MADSDIFFIDMELCDLTMALFLQQKWRSRAWERSPRIQSHLSGPSDEVVQIRHIMQDIARGIAFIHSLKEIHRDLKPQNGKPIPVVWTRANSLQQCCIQAKMTAGRYRISESQLKAHQTCAQQLSLEVLLAIVPLSFS